MIQDTLYPTPDDVILLISPAGVPPDDIIPGHIIRQCQVIISQNAGDETRLIGFV